MTLNGSWNYNSAKENEQIKGSFSSSMSMWSYLESRQGDEPHRQV